MRIPSLIALSLLAMVGFHSAHAKMSQNSIAIAPTFIAVSDIHLNQQLEEITYGENTGAPLWDRTCEKLRALISRPNHAPQFAIFLGDLPAHHLSDTARLANETRVLKDLTMIAGSALPIFYVPGNNDGMNGNYHSFDDAQGKTILSLDKEAGWPVANGKASCNASPNDACLLDNTHLKQGYYSAYLLGANAHWRLIALNTTIFSPKYQADDGITQQTAADDEIDWLAEQLNDAQAKGDKVFIAMHIPPGFDAYGAIPMWASIPYQKMTIEQAFIHLVDQYQDIISGLLSSHTHYDEIRKIYNTQHQFIALDMSVPGITPLHYNNPGFKLFSYRPHQYTLLDAETFYTLPKAKEWGNMQYHFASDYDCPVNATLFQCVARIQNPKTLAADMNKDYLLRNMTDQPNWQAVDRAIEVNY